MSAERLIGLYHEATPEQAQRGREWYDDFRAACRGMSHGYRTPLANVVHVAAATSPACHVRTNLAWTREAVRTNGAARVGRYPNAMAPRVRAALDGRHEAVGGLKVRHFARAILGDTSAVVLDRWALRAVGHHADSCTPNQYARYAAVYTEAAEAVGETPRDFQAIVWIVLRERATASNGRPLGLADIRDLEAA